MFHLKILTKDSHADLAAIQTALTTHPTRHFVAKTNSYHFPITDVKTLLQGKCGICLQNEDNFSKEVIHEFIDLGKETVVICPKDFSEDDILTHLEKGASTVVAFEDGFDVFQIKKLVTQGKEKTYIKGGTFLENHIKDYLETGGSVLLEKGDLSPFAISRLLPFGENRIHIQGAGFSNLRIDKFLEGKAKIIFGEGNQLSQPRIKKKVTNFKDQISLSSTHFSFDSPWLEEMEKLGARII